MTSEELPQGWGQFFLAGEGVYRSRKEFSSGRDVESPFLKEYFLARLILFAVAWCRCSVSWLTISETLSGKG